MKPRVRDLRGLAEPLAGRTGLGRAIASPHVATPDLAGRFPGRDLASSVVLLGPRQMAALGALPQSECRKLVRSLLRAKPSCVLVTGGSVPKEVLAGAEAARVTLLRTRNLAGVRKLLAQRLEPRVSMHGVLVEVFGLGTLIIGESGIGKSEAALDLVLRGHKLAADDIVVLDRADSAITGRPTDLGANLLQIRGLGIINVRDLYGDSATTASCPVGLVVELEEWRKGERYSLLGLRERRYRIQGIGIPYLKLPVRPGRTMATLIEVAARNQLLKNRGVYTARELNRRLAKRLKG